MKNNWLLHTLVALLTFIPFAHGASYSISNGLGVDATGIANASGVAFQNNGVVAIGVVSTTSFESFTTTSEFVNSFTQFGTSTSFLDGGIFGNKGVFQLSVAGTAAASPFLNGNIVLLVGNNSSIATSTQFLILDTGRDFLAADDNSGTPIDVTVNGSSVILWGAAASDIRTTTLDTTITPGYLTASPVPEPTFALLGALGGLVLLRRRR